LPGHDQDRIRGYYGPALRKIREIPGRLGRALSSALFPVIQLDPIPVAQLTSVLVAVAAACVPARRAKKVDPVVALRYE
jgi:ABC-type antimicrobial peptide transport system permease subunit